MEVQSLGWEDPSREDATLSILNPYYDFWDSLVAQTVKNLPTMWETCIWSLGSTRAPGKGMATHSSILAWKIPWTAEPGGPQFVGSQRVGHDWETNTQVYKNWGFPGVSGGKDSACKLKKSACHAGDMGSIPESGSGRFPWRRKWQPTPVLFFFLINF